MSRYLLLLTFALTLWAQAPYVPARHDWQQRTPAAVKIDAAKLQAAIAFAQQNETKAPRDLRRNHDLTFGREAYGEPLGPFSPRGEPTGVILRHGYLVAEWGEPQRVDMTFSVTKSFLSTLVGLAWDRGLIGGLDEPVAPYVPGELFSGPHNSRITWDHLLRQTSDWEGTLWDKPDWADRPPKERPLAQHIARPRHAPGSVYTYNDVRVNLLALAALHVWRKPLPQVLREEVMDPIGASTTWRWLGYGNSWVELDGQRMQSVSGGGHWGGGMLISARDMARFGLLTLRRGQWGERQVLPERWIRHALTPTAANPGYGVMNWFLNTGRKMMPSAPESVYVHVGNGANYIYVDPELDVVAVVRWIESSQLDGFVQRLRAAVE